MPDKSAAFEIVADAIAAFETTKEKRLCHHDLSSSTNIPISSLWFPIRNERTWTADRWLKVLYALGALRFDGDSIIIVNRANSKLNGFFSKVKPL